MSCRDRKRTPVGTVENPGDTSCPNVTFIGCPFILGLPYRVMSPMISYLDFLIWSRVVISLSEYDDGTGSLTAG